MARFGSRSGWTSRWPFGVHTEIAVTPAGHIVEFAEVSTFVQRFTTSLSIVAAISSSNRDLRRNLPRPQPTNRAFRGSGRSTMIPDRGHLPNCRREETSVATGGQWRNRCYTVVQTPELTKGRATSHRATCESRPRVCAGSLHHHLTLHWTASFRASCLHAAEAVARGQVLADARLAEAIADRRRNCGRRSRPPACRATRSGVTCGVVGRGGQPAGTGRTRGDPVAGAAAAERARSWSPHCPSAGGNRVGRADRSIPICWRSWRCANVRCASNGRRAGPACCGASRAGPTRGSCRPRQGRARPPGPGRRRGSPSPLQSRPHRGRADESRCRNCRKCCGSAGCWRS